LQHTAGAPHLCALVNACERVKLTDERVSVSERHPCAGRDCGGGATAEDLDLCGAESLEGMQGGVTFIEGAALDTGALVRGAISAVVLACERPRITGLIIKFKVRAGALCVNRVTPVSV
jgi:hypothetical protein